MKIKYLLYVFSAVVVLVTFLQLQSCNPDEPQPKNPNFYQLETDFSTTIGNELVKRTIIGISFIDDNNGVICGDFGLLAKTSNGGKTWQQLDIGMSGAISNVFMVSKEVFFVAGVDLYLTKNSGENFSQVQTPTQHVRGVHFINEQQGIVNLNGYIYSTEDGGQTWMERYNSAPREHFVFPSTNVGYCAEYDIIKTTDGGITWNNIGEQFNNNLGLEYEDTIYQLTFVNDIIGYCYYTVIKNGGFVNLDELISFGLYKTIDGGITWELKNNDSMAASDMLFINEQEGYIVGSHGIWHTTDGATTWKQVEQPIFDDKGNPYRLKIIDKTPNHLYVVGDNGIILKKDL